MSVLHLGVVEFELLSSVETILWCDRSNETASAVFTWDYLFSM